MFLQTSKLQRLEQNAKMYRKQIPRAARLVLFVFSVQNWDINQQFMVYFSLHSCLENSVSAWWDHPAVLTFCTFALFKLFFYFRPYSVAQARQWITYFLQLFPISSPPHPLHSLSQPAQSFICLFAAASTYRLANEWICFSPESCWHSTASGCRVLR